jgi:hypothetical protein
MACEPPWEYRMDFRWDAGPELHRCNVYGPAVRALWILSAVLWPVPALISSLHFKRKVDNRPKGMGALASLRIHTQVSRLHVSIVVLSVLFLALSILRAVDLSSNVIGWDAGATLLYISADALMVWTIWYVLVIFFHIAARQRFMFGRTQDKATQLASLAACTFLLAGGLCLVVVLVDPVHGDEGFIAFFALNAVGFAIILLIIPQVLSSILTDFAIALGKNSSVLQTVATQRLQDMETWIRRMKVVINATIVFLVLQQIVVAAGTPAARARPRSPGGRSPGSPPRRALVSNAAAHVVGRGGVCLRGSRFGHLCAPPAGVVVSTQLREE